MCDTIKLGNTQGNYRDGGLHFDQQCVCLVGLPKLKMNFEET